MKSWTEHQAWTVDSSTHPPRSDAVRPMIARSNLDPAGGEPWSGVQALAQLGCAGAVLYLVPHLRRDPDLLLMKRGEEWRI